MSRQHTEAYKFILNYILVFILSVSFAVGAPTYISAVNDLSKEVSSGILDAGLSIVDLTNGITGNTSYDTAVANAEPDEKIAEMLFRITIRNSWLYLEFGDTDEEYLGEERVSGLRRIK